MLEAFRPDLAPEEGERNMLIGLDTILTGSLSELMSWAEAPVGLPPDPFHPERPCNAITTFDREGAELVWGAFKASNGMKNVSYKGAPSEMILLRSLWEEHAWPMIDPAGEACLSYKMDVQHKRRDWREEGVMIYFHGRPKPQDLVEGSELKKVWETGHRIEEL